MLLADPSGSEEIRVEVALPPRDTVLKHRTREVRVRLRGEEFVAMDDFGTDLTVFEPY